MFKNFIWDERLDQRINNRLRGHFLVIQHWTSERIIILWLTITSYYRILKTRKGIWFPRRFVAEIAIRSTSYFDQIANKPLLVILPNASPKMIAQSFINLLKLLPVAFMFHLSREGTLLKSASAKGAIACKWIETKIIARFLPKRAGII